MIFLNEHSPSTLAKVSMSLGVLAGVCAGTLIASGHSDGNSYRVLLMFACCFFYFIRFTFTLFVFIQRKISWAEAGLVSFLFFMMFYYFCASAGNYPAPIGVLDLLGVFLFAAGSWINISSDYQRFSWKKNTENQGRLYTSGLFRHAMHINYFGDALAYFGLALISHNIGCVGIAIGMVVYFIGFEIPRLDEHLSRKYKDEFADYARRTKKFVPFVY